MWSYNLGWKWCYFDGNLKVRYDNWFRQKGQKIEKKEKKEKSVETQQKIMIRSKFVL